MKRNFIEKVIDRMQYQLDSNQTKELKMILISEMQQYELRENKENVVHRQEENKKLLYLFISAKKVEGCSSKTLVYYENTINCFLDKIEVALSRIETNDIREYLAKYQEEKKSSKVTIDNMRRIFSSFFAWLEDEDYIAKSPVRRIHKIKTNVLVKDVLSDEELENLRDNCDEIRDLAIIDLLSSTGIRIGELIKLNREDINFQERQCVVFGKGNKERTVYFNARTKIHLQKYLSTRDDNNSALFVSLHSPHNRMSINGIEYRLKELGKKLNIAKVHPHKFRRTLATMAIDKGMPIEQVQCLLGHVRIDTTLHYEMVNQNNVKMAHRKFIG